MPNDPKQPEVSNKPRVFVSSTIRDFEDLRSALKFWLEEMGLEVNMSEFNDFARPPEAGTFESCFEAIGLCDYYVLLVGFRKGSEYKAGVSVTQEEFRRAVALARGGKLKPVVFVRADVETILRERLTIAAAPSEPIVEGGLAQTLPSANLENPDFTQAFVDEIRATSIGASGSEDPPGSIWTYPFSHFSDIAEALRVNLRLSVSVKKKALMANVKWELEENIAALCTRWRNTPFPNHWYASSARKRLELRGVRPEEEIEVPEQHARDLAFFWQCLGRAENLHTTALNEAIHSGEFLVYVQSGDRLDPGEVRKGLAVLVGAIEAYQAVYRILRARISVLEVIRQEVKAHKRTVLFTESDLIMLFRLHDLSEDIFSLSAGLIGYALHPEAGYRLPKLQPVSPIESQVAGIEAERASHEDVEQWVRDGDLWGWMAEPLEPGEDLIARLERYPNVKAQFDAKIKEDGQAAGLG